MGDKRHFWISGVLAFTTILIVVLLLITKRLSPETTRDPIDEELINQLITEFQKTYSPMERIAFPVNWEKKFPDSLYRPEFLFPVPEYFESTDLIEILGILESCRETNGRGASRGALKKYWQLYLHKCKKKSLPESVWKKPPLRHPFGGSWALWLFRNGYKDLSWLKEQKKFLHILEYEEILGDTSSAFIKSLKAMEPGDLQKIMLNKPIILSNEFLFLYSHHQVDEFFYQQYPASQWNQFLERHLIVMKTSPNGSCLLINNNYCWAYIKQNNFMLDEGILERVLFLSFLLFIIYFFYFLWRNYRTEMDLRNQHQLVMQTLAHELRHPVTAFRLSIEAIRPSYDELSDKVGVEFLRLADTSKKMSRIVKFSRSYLQLLLKDGQFAIQENQVDSFRNFIENSLEDYSEKIKFHHPKMDRSLRVDTHWLSTCVQNLVINALTHGEKPILVTWKSRGSDLEIEVQDNGFQLDEDLKNLTKPHIRRSESGGLGLGLGMVYQLVRLMNGSLILQTKPTRFIIRLKGVCSEKNPSR